jgi:protease I
MNKKVAIIIASKDFRDEEYFITKETLENNNIKVMTVCDEKNAIGRLGGEAIADIIIDKLNINDFDGIIFAGGGGALEKLDNQVSYDICKECIEKGKILAAICISPVILANAGVLKGVNATVWSSNMDKSPIAHIEERGASYEEKSVIVDKNIITGRNPEASKEFGETISKTLTKS